MHFFSEPLPEGWIYPCSVEEIEAALEALPENATEGITTVGLCRSTNRDNYANARYFFGESARIHIYSWKSDLRLRLPADIKRHEAERYFEKELDYGMAIDVSDRRLTCVWESESLKRFILEHVLVHEIGHHRYYRTRIAAGLTFQPGTKEAEAFAESYARRFNRLRNRRSSKDRLANYDKKS